eukprot:gene19636-22329_t
MESTRSLHGRHLYRSAEELPNNLTSAVKMPPTKSFPAIEGLRALFNFWIVALHQHMFQKCFLALYGKMDLLEHLADSAWSGIALGHGYQVDVFFALSGFLFTWGLIQPSQQAKSLYGHVVALVLFVAKRVLRLWPVLACVLVIAFAVKDAWASNIYELLMQLTIPNYRDAQPQATVPGWSNRVDLESCIVLFLVISTLKYFNLLNRFTSLLLIPLSLIPKASRFLSDPDAFSYMRLGADVFTTAVHIPIHTQGYYRDVMYPHTNHTFPSIEPAQRMTPLFYGEYCVTHQRWSPLFVGSAVAVALFAAYQRAKEPRQDKKEATMLTKVVNVLSRVFAFLLLLVSILLAAFPILTSLSPADGETRATVLSNPPIEADFFISVLGRTLNACGWGYILYRCLLPEGHPLRLNLLSSFLGNPFFRFVGKHSYCIYMLHYIVMHYVSFHLLVPTNRPAFVGEDVPDQLLPQFFVLLACSYSITFVLSMVIVRFVEEPALKVLQSQMKIVEKALLGDTSAKKKL